MIDGAAVRVDTGLPTEERRYIFATAAPAITELAATITRPRILIKLAAPLQELLALLPPGWQPHPQSFFMACSGAMSGRRALPAGYAIEVGHDGATVVARVEADGRVVASGRAVRHDGLTVYDQIVTDPGHGRRGLGSAVMRALEDAVGAAACQVLTATAAGERLYTTLGWRTLSLYSTVERSGAEPGRA